MRVSRDGSVLIQHPGQSLWRGFLALGPKRGFVQSLSCVWLCIPMDCSMPGFPVLYYLSEFAEMHVHWVGDAIQPFHPLSPPSPLALNLSQHQALFLWVSSWHQVAKVLELSFSISPFNEYSGLISFRIDWFDLPAIQGTLKSLLSTTVRMH